MYPHLYYYYHHTQVYKHTHIHACTRNARHKYIRTKTVYKSPKEVTIAAYEYKIYERVFVWTYNDTKYFNCNDYDFVITQTRLIFFFFLINYSDRNTAAYYNMVYVIIKHVSKLGIVFVVSKHAALTSYYDVCIPQCSALYSTYIGYMT